VLVLSLIPLKSVLLSPGETDNWIGLISIGVSLGFFVGLRVPTELRASAQYGTFGWDNQIGRLELLAVATVLNTAIVVRSRRFWLDSMRDRLTGLFNRGFFDESLMRLVEARVRSRNRFAVAIADFDHFTPLRRRGRRPRRRCARATGHDQRWGCGISRGR
jgi:hypothetical protein